jgi:hypothetical protein
VANSAGVNFIAARNVGTAFTFTPPGQNVTINAPGLYLIEWTMNLASGNPASRVGISANGTPDSIAGNSATVGNFSSGALINVSTVPFTLSLRNYSGAQMTLENVANAPYSAASVRIIKIADVPSA